jgi:peptide chain release factor 1
MMNDLLTQLRGITERFDELGLSLSDPSTSSDISRFIQLQREYKELEPVVEAKKTYENMLAHIQSAKSVLLEEKDPEFREMARAELEELEEQLPNLEAELRQLLIPKDPEDSRNAILEIRGGTGGDEAALFAGDLFRMYARYADQQGWKLEIVDETPGTMGGYKEIIANITGNQVYGKLKFESGVHRVQRVPSTETQGRVHTSAASVVILPEAEEIDVVIKPNDIRKDTYCSSGAGGQSVNTTYSAVRLTHLKTGIVVQCQDERSQLRNFDKAMTVLRARIYEIEYRKKMDDIAGKRKTIVSTGDRSAKIRTYNFPQSRVTDHRIGFTSHDLPGMLNGNINELVESLIVAENTEKLREGQHA